MLSFAAAVRRVRHRGTRAAHPRVGRALHRRAPLGLTLPAWQGRRWSPRRGVRVHPSQPMLPTRSVPVIHTALGQAFLMSQYFLMLERALLATATLRLQACRRLALTVHRQRVVTVHRKPAVIAHRQRVATVHRKLAVRVLRRRVATVHRKPAVKALRKQVRKERCHLC